MRIKEVLRKLDVVPRQVHSEVVITEVGNYTFLSEDFRYMQLLPHPLTSEEGIVRKEGHDEAKHFFCASCGGIDLGPCRPSVCRRRRLQPTWTVCWSCCSWRPVGVPREASRFRRQC